MQQCRSNALSNITNQLSKRQGVEEKQPIYPQLPLKYRNNEQYIQSGLENKSELSHNSPLLQDNIDDILLLSNSKWGLEPQFVNGLRHCGIERMHQWQADCLSLPGLFQGEKNLVYTAPTSAGKSLVAEILMITRVIETRTKAIVVLPYVAIVTEKVKFLKRLVDGIEPRVIVTGYHGGAKVSTGWKNTDISICTIEKANSIVNAALEDGSIGDLGTVVFDELHMLEDAHRGYILEVLATKLLCLQQGLQIIGMSATLSNMPELAEWLQAHHYDSSYRPIPLQEYLVYENEVHNEYDEIVAQIPPSELKELKEPVINAIISLAYGCVIEGHSALVFCSTRDMTEKITKLLCQFMPGVDEDIAERRREVIRDLAASSTGLDRILGTSIPMGVAYHHAGLTVEERDIIAEAYDKNLIKVICCTPTMAAGVNLPARRVIIIPRTGRALLSPAMLRQMIGRAGRKGRDTVGESYLCCPKVDKNAVKDLLKAPMPRVKSCLDTEASGLQRALLEVIATRLATSSYSLDDYVQCTLLYHTSPNKEAIKHMVQSALAALVSSKLLSEDDMGGFEASPIGQATVASGLRPEEGVFLYSELNRALRAFNLETDMHIIYTFTPIYGVTDIKWTILRDEIERLDESGLRTATFVGVNPALVNRMAQGGVLKETPENTEKMRVHRRFFVSLMLRDLINEMPIHHVASKYETPRGFVQQLASTCKGFANTTGIFCKRLGWSGLAVLLDHYTFRLDMGVRDDLMELVKLPFVKSYTARIIYNAGLRNIAAVAAVEPQDLVPILEAVSLILCLYIPKSFTSEGCLETKLMSCWCWLMTKCYPMLMQAQPQKLKLRSEEQSKLRKRLEDRAQRIIRAARRLHDQDQVVELDE